MDVLNDRDHGVTMLVATGKITTEEAKQMMSEIRSDASITGVARQISQQQGVSMKHAYHLARQAQEQEPAAEGWSLKDYVLEVLYRLNSNAGVRPDTIISALKGMGHPTHLQELNTVLWDLQKLQLVKFNESHGAGGSMLARIRLTPRGRSRIVQKRGTTQQAVVRVNTKAIKERGPSQNNRHGAVHAAGIDRTYFRNHRKTAEGGEVTREEHRPVEKDGVLYCIGDGEGWPCKLAEERGISAQPSPMVVKATEYKPEPQKPLGDPLPQNMKAPLELPIDTDGEPQSRFATKLKTAYGEARAVRASVREGSLWDEMARRVRPSIDGFPGLLRLVERQAAKIEAKAKAETMISAAAMIAEIDPEESERMVQKAGELEGEPLTNFEQEVLRFIEAVVS